MMDYALSRVLHVLAVVLWIGGVGFVTTVLLPAVRRMKNPEEWMAFFEEVESRFATQARATTLLAGTTGFYLLHRLSAWSWFGEPSHWYLHAMVGVWLVFTLMLFVLESLFLHRWFQPPAARDPEGTFRIIQRLHVVLLTISLIATAGAMADAHGWLWVGG